MDEYECDLCGGWADITHHSHNGEWIVCDQCLALTPGYVSDYLTGTDMPRAGEAEAWLEKQRASAE